MKEGYRDPEILLFFSANIQYSNRKHRYKCETQKSRFGRAGRNSDNKCITLHLFSFILNRQQFKCHNCGAMQTHHPDLIHNFLSIAVVAEQEPELFPNS